MTIRYKLVSLLILATGCGRPLAASHTYEAPDFLNTLDNFGISKIFTYTGLSGKTDVNAPDIPWTDSYWPLVRKSMAWRYAVTTESPDAAKEEIKIADFFRHFSAEAAKDEPDPLLSPAEKYDLAFQYRHSLALPLAELKKLSADLATQDAAIRGKTAIKDKRPLVEAMKQSLMASGIEPAMSMTVSGWADFLHNSADSHNKYLGLDAGDGDDWSWEGHCHGWAPAAVMSQPPKHGVMALLGGKKVFFSEGDIRGLMSKAWADRAPDGDKSYFLGRRCEEHLDDSTAPIEANAAGKGYTGTLKVNGSNVWFVMLDSMPSMLGVTVGGHETSLNVYRIKLDTTGEEKILVEDARGGNFWTVGTFVELAQAVRSGEFAGHLIATEVNMTGCWDPNPASFHAVLVEQLDTRKAGFVMDRTRTGQVWNQPIYSGSFAIGPLVAVGSVADIAAPYRSAGTAFLAEVTAAVVWSAEPPRAELAYDKDFDAGQLRQSVYQYTLEFDAEQRLIGGEWGTLDAMDPAAESPDFLFGYTSGAVPYDAINTEAGTARLDYSGLIAKLQACSRDDTVDGSLTVRAKIYPYTSCTIDKAAP